VSSEATTPTEHYPTTIDEALPKARLRQGIFLSHATPGDNAFVIWLGGKLSALGYDVWADVFRLKGGDDWERILEDAIRNKAAKVLVAANPESVARQGVRNEIKIAIETGKKIGDEGFIIPLRMAEYDSPYMIVYAQWVDFKASWADGLSVLVKALEDANVPRLGPTERTAYWTELQLGQVRELTAGPEILISNWLAVKTLPSELFVYDFAAGISIGAKDAAIKTCHLPLVPYGRGFISFAPQIQLQEHFGELLPLKRIAIIDTEEYGASGSASPKIASVDARRHLVELMRRGIERFVELKALQQTELANDRRIWWPDKGLVGLEQKAFGWPGGPAGRRQLVGQSRARNVFWHYGVSFWPSTSPLHHIRLSGHVSFTLDGRKIVGDARRMHRMRRTLCRSWRNDRWRDLLLALLYWLGDGATELRVALGNGADMVLGLPPMHFTAEFGLGPPLTLASVSGADVPESDDAVPSNEEEDALQESDEPYEEDGDDECEDGETA
jgi:hypothetical protein